MTFISHSGSAFAALSFNDRGIGFNLIVSSGQELVTDVAAYMEHAMGLASTRVIATLIETVRRPDAFRAALAHAADRDIPVIALKVGRTERSKSMVTAHSGALAGEDGAYEALFDAFGVLRVATLDEMADAMELFSSPRRVTTGGGIASIHDSGGERALLVDLAADLGVPFARISDATTERIQAALDPGLEAANPLDAWGTGIDADRIFVECFRALHDDPDTAALAFVVDMTRQGEPHDEGYLHVAREVFAQTTKPFCILSNLASAVANDEAGLVRDAGIPVLEGTASGLAALRHLLAYRDQGSLPPVVPPQPVTDDVRERWRARLAAGGEVSELEGLAMLNDYGVPTTETRGATSIEGAIAAAEGWMAGRDEDGRARCPTQVRRRRRRPRPAGCGGPPDGIRRHGVPARSPGGPSAHGSGRHRARARHRPRSHSSGRSSWWRRAASWSRSSTTGGWRSLHSMRPGRAR